MRCLGTSFFNDTGYDLEAMEMPRASRAPSSNPESALCICCSLVQFNMALVYVSFLKSWVNIAKTEIMKENELKDTSTR